jgi:hypothetical protein
MRDMPGFVRFVSFVAKRALRFKKKHCVLCAFAVTKRKTMTTISDTRFCSICAREAGLRPVGHGGQAFDVIIAAEMPLPWPRLLWSDAARLPAEMLAVMEHIRDEYQRTHQVRIRMIGIAPDAEYSQPGMRRVIGWRRPAGPFTRFERTEYLVPEEKLGPLVYELALGEKSEVRSQKSEVGSQKSGGPGSAPFEQYRLPDAEVRDLLVCTHGAVDAACSKFGYPAYSQLRRLAAEAGGTLRAWRSTHFGGHVFAPTLIDMPHGSYWAYIEGAEAEILAQRSGDVRRLRGNYRGWTGLPAPFLQVLEHELLMRFGWPWLDYTKAGRVLAQQEAAPSDEHGDSTPHWAEVQLDYSAPDGSAGRATARIEIEEHIETPHSSGEDERHPYPQYSIAWLHTLTR